MCSVYERRLKRIRKTMAECDIEAVYLKMSSDLQYLTGVSRPPHNPTDDDKHADELYGAFITLEDGPVFVVPRMAASSHVKNQSEGKPWIKT